MHLPSKNNQRPNIRFKEKRAGGILSASFATAQKEFNNQVYLEWQVGYDAADSDIESGKKSSSVHEPQFQFIGANKKKKYPYEISEVLYELIRNEIASLKDLDSLAQEISSYSQFFQEELPVEPIAPVQVNDLTFQKSAITLPTYHFQNQDGTYVEVTLQKQQYASGTQPMVYFCIPITCFSNGSDFLQKTSKDISSMLIYKIDRSKVSVVLNLFKILASASDNHKTDVIEILKALRRGLA